MFLVYICLIMFVHVDIWWWYFHFGPGYFYFSTTTGLLRKFHLTVWKYMVQYFQSRFLGHAASFLNCWSVKIPIKLHCNPYKHQSNDIKVITCPPHQTNTPPFAALSSSTFFMSMIHLSYWISPSPTCKQLIINNRYSFINTEWRAFFIRLELFQ